MLRSLAGTRIREQRLRAGLSQSALARHAGISASYLNLIEHNKRGIAGKVLLAIAHELGVPPSSLSEGADSELINTLQEASSQIENQPSEVAELTQFAGRYPGWSGLLANLFSQTRDQERAITALSDRLTHDPFLSESLHQMLSNITAIRSTAGILRTIDDISPDQRSRFHAAIHDESKRLSDAARSLIEYFDQSSDQLSNSAIPEEEVDRFLSSHNYHFPALDSGSADIADIINASDILGTTQAIQMAGKVLEDYLGDTKSMPLNEFTAAAFSNQFNPAPLATEFNVPMHAVFRRLASLQRQGISAPSIGLIAINAAGYIKLRRPIAGFPIPRHGNACPLWPLYQALSQPDRPSIDFIILPDTSEFVCISLASSHSPANFDSTANYHSSMMIISKEHAHDFLPWIAIPNVGKPVGSSCRICPRNACAERCEGRIMG